MRGEIIRRLLQTVLLPVALVLDLVYIYFRSLWTIILGFFDGWLQFTIKPFLLFILIVVLLYRYYAGRRDRACYHVKLPIVGICYACFILASFFICHSLWRDIVLMPICTSIGVIVLDYAYVRDGLPVWERVLIEPAVVTLFNNLYEMSLFTYAEYFRLFTPIVPIVFIILFYSYFADYIVSIRYRKLFYISLIILIVENCWLFLSRVIGLLHLPHLATYPLSIAARLSPYLLALSLEHDVSSHGSLLTL